MEQPRKCWQLHFSDCLLDTNAIVKGAADDTLLDDGSPLMLLLLLILPSCSGSPSMRVLLRIVQDCGVLPTIFTGKVFAPSWIQHYVAPDFDGRIASVTFGSCIADISDFISGASSQARVLVLPDTLLGMQKDTGSDSVDPVDIYWISGTTNADQNIPWVQTRHDFKSEILPAPNDDIRILRKFNENNSLPLISGCVYPVKLGSSAIHVFQIASTAGDLIRPRGHPLRFIDPPNRFKNIAKWKELLPNENDQILARMLHDALFSEMKFKSIGIEANKLFVIEDFSEDDSLRNCCKIIGVNLFPMSVLDILSIAFEKEDYENHFQSAIMHPKMMHCFSRAFYSAPSVILLSDLEMLNQKGGNEDIPIDFMVNSLNQMAQLVSSYSGVALIVTANAATSIPQAIRKLFNPLQFKLPRRHAREAIIKQLLEEFGYCDTSIVETLAQITPGYSQYELRKVFSMVHLLKYKISTNELENLALKFAETLTFSGGPEPDDFANFIGFFRQALNIVKPENAVLSKYCTLKRYNPEQEKVCGYESVMDDLHRMIRWPSQYSKTFRRLHISPSRGALLYGPSGCGKSLITRNLSGSYSYHVLYLKGPELFSKYIGETERIIRKVFHVARSIVPCVLVIDDLEFFGSKRGVADSTDSKVEERLLTTLLNEIDGIDTDSKDGLFVLGCASDRELIDEALLRPGRLGNHIYVGIPSSEDRRKILQFYCKDLSIESPVFEWAMEKTDGWNGADLEKLSRYLQYHAKKAPPNSKIGKVTISRYLDHF